MTNQDYIKNIARLKEIEDIVKNPESSLDKIDGLIEETKELVKECYSYTRSLKQKVDSLADIDKEANDAERVSLSDAQYFEDNDENLPF